MRIGIDARWIFPELSGIGAYTQELIRALAALDRRNEYVLLFQRLDVQQRVSAYAGLMVRPGTNYYQLYIVSNDASNLTVWGDATQGGSGRPPR